MFLWRLEERWRPLRPPFSLQNIKSARAAPRQPWADAHQRGQSALPPGPGGAVASRQWMQLVRGLHYNHIYPTVTHHLPAASLLFAGDSGGWLRLKSAQGSTEAGYTRDAWRKCKRSSPLDPPLPSAGLRLSHARPPASGLQQLQSAKRKRSCFDARAGSPIIKLAM
jgi:hypothetical protein